MFHFYEENKAQKQQRQVTSNDIIVGNGSEKLMIELKFIGKRFFPGW